MQKVISCTGFGSSGSSCISDFLKEFSNVVNLGDFEFSIAHEVDGISDLQHYIADDFQRNKTSEGIYRFRRLVKNIAKEYNRYLDNKFTQYSDEFIKDIVKFEWKGVWHQHRLRASWLKRMVVYAIPTFVQRKFLHPLKHSDYELSTWMHRERMESGRGLDSFLEATRNYFEKLFNVLNPDGKYEYVQLDQLVPSNNYKRYLKYFNNLKIIEVDRDPRDMYILNRKFWHEGWIPSDDIQQFIDWFKFIRKQDNATNLEDKVLKINLEDFIYHYDETAQKVMNFIGLSPTDHISPRTSFIPEVSVKNTKLWIKYPEFSEEIKMIESQLPEYLYNYNE